MAEGVAGNSRRVVSPTCWKVAARASIGKKQGGSLFFVYTIRIMFEWDDDKAAANLAKHGVSFERVREFEWNTAQINVDDREDYGEVRMIALGFIGSVLHVLVFTERSDNIRVISMRKANAREVKAYA